MNDYEISFEEKSFDNCLPLIEGYSPTIFAVPSHLSPCLNKPYSRVPQWSQKVGDM